jgi:hypothetical protein
MKQFVEVCEVEDDGFTPLMGENITCLCASYFYTGKLVGVNKDFIVLEDPAIVYETGDWKTKTYTDVQSLPTKTLRVRTQAIEAYGKLK